LEIKKAAIHDLLSGSRAPSEPASKRPQVSRNAAISCGIATNVLPALPTTRSDVPAASGH
jgi:hypothetical protein